MFRINEEEWGPKRNLDDEFGLLVARVNAVNHGEFEKAVEMLEQQASREDAHGEERCSAFALQRCRRGGKTFMLHNVASKLTQKVDSETHVIFISLNSTSRYIVGEDAYQAILGRIAWEYTGSYFTDSYDDFSEQHTDFRDVGRWVRANKVILVVDELNAIAPDAPNYRKMSRFLDELVGRRGCSMVYSTHLRDTRDLLRDRLAGESASVSLRDHEWLMIPRIVNENCLRGLRNDWTTQPSFWCAVLRGRLPALLVQPQRHIEKYGEDLFKNTSEEERVAALAAVITGEIGSLPNTRNQFRAYSYMSERFAHGKKALFAWPPFLVSQLDVLGKECGSLCTNLEDPSIDEAKAFEALTQLAVLVRLLSAQHHELVPHNTDIPDDGSFEATEILHVASSATTIAGVIEAVKIEFSQRPHVLQVVAVPYFASFPTYDFFVLHRADDVGWRIAAGYQCKQGTEHPTEDASPDVPLSIWIEGKCRKYRIAEDGARVQKTVRLGWVLLGEESDQVCMLGVSVSEALPAPSPASTEGYRLCSAEMVCAGKMKAAASPGSSETSDDAQQENPRAKKARTEATTHG